MSTGEETVRTFDLVALNQGNRGTRLSDPAIETRVDELLSRMTRAQKLAQMHGVAFDPDERGLFCTADEPALGIPGFKMVDGPRGVRAGTATTFPVAMARGATWNPELEARIGQAIGREARARGANVLLAPAINLLRHPGWGRAQETYGEDPLHVGNMGAAFIAGAQRELVASVKHFALNSIEDTRFDVDVQVDERTLREVYLPHFERCVRDAHVGSVMSAYNKVNGHYCAENVPLLREILRGDWGFRGFVESDWVLGTRSTVPSVRAGLDIEMPDGNYYGCKLTRALQRGELAESAIDEAVRRILRVKLAFGLDAQEPVSPDVIECHAHQELALQAAHQSMVLLKNEGELLPLDPRAGRIAVVGSLAALENTGDRGSSAVESSFVISALEGIRDRVGERNLLALPRDALTPAERRELVACSAAIVVVGLTWREEGELIPFLKGGGDRDSLRLSPTQEALVHEVSALCPRTVVVLQAGSALELRAFAEVAPALLMAWYPGMLGGEALADVLFGRVCPSGKLPVSFPRSRDDLVEFDHRSHRVTYDYDHGYRKLDRRAHTPEFPFGFGLSYTRFAYESIRLDRSEISRDDSLEVLVRVKNLGARTGTEVVQLYLACPDDARGRPLRSLVGFGRLTLAPGESKVLRMTVRPRDFAWFDPARRAFVVEPGEYQLFAGGSSRDLPLRAGVCLR